MLPVRVNVDEDGTLRAGIGNLQSCGSWYCTRCGPKISIERAAETAHMLRVWAALGHSAVLLTLTARHHRGHRLDDLIRGMRGAWRSTWNGKAGTALRDRMGVEWRIRVIEVTHGDAHGWHPHFHVLIFRAGPQPWLDTPDGRAAARDAFRPVWTRWAAGLARLGFDALDEVDGESAGFDVRPVDLESEEAIRAMAEYVEKGSGARETRRVRGVRTPAMSAGIELLGGVFKRGGAPEATVGARHRSIAQVMEDYAVASGAEDESLVREFLAAAHGLRQRDPSKGMRAWFAAMAEELGIPGPLLAEERTDDEIAAADDVADSTTVGWISARAWSSYLVFEYHQLRGVARVGGLAALVAWLDRRDAGFEWAESLRLT
jgi:hypothetical protein